MNQPTTVPQFKQGISYLELAVSDAMYKPPVEALPVHLFSEDAGMGLRKPDHPTVSYQRLWEYYTQMDILREAVKNDIALTGVYPQIDAGYSGVGFDEEANIN
jgi:hypothetical protein